MATLCGQAKAGVTVVVGGAAAGESTETARVARLAAEAAARAGVPLLLLQPAPLAASWEVLALYPHEDVLAQVTLGSRLVTLPLNIWHYRSAVCLLQAGADLCRAKGWQRAVLLHEGSARSAALIAPDEEQLELKMRRLPPSHEDALLRLARPTLATPYVAAAIVTHVHVQEHPARPEESGRDQLHRVVRGGVRCSRDGRSAARRAAGRTTFFRDTLPRAAHAAVAHLQPRWR